MKPLKGGVGIVKFIIVHVVNQLLKSKTLSRLVDYQNFHKRAYKQTRTVNGSYSKM